MAVTSPTPCAGWTALSPTLKFGAGERRGNLDGDAGRRPGRLDGRMRMGGAGGGSVDRSSRFASALGAGGRGVGRTSGGAGALVSARVGAFTAFLPFGLPFDFAREVDATAPRVEEGTARAAEPVRGRGIDVRGFERAGWATTFVIRRHPQGGRGGCLVLHDLVDPGVRCGVETAGEGDGIEHHLQAEGLGVAGDAGVFERMVEPEQAAEGVVGQELQGRNETLGGGGRVGAPGSGERELDLERVAGRALDRVRGGRDGRRGAQQTARGRRTSSPSNGPGAKTRSGASPSELGRGGERLGVQGGSRATKLALREVDGGLQGAQVAVLEPHGVAPRRGRPARDPAPTLPQRRVTPPSTARPSTVTLRAAKAASMRAVWSGVLASESVVAAYEATTRAST